MKAFFSVVVAFLTAAASLIFSVPPAKSVNPRFVPRPERSQKVKIMSYNVYVAGAGELSPENRTPLVVEKIRGRDPDSFGLQEADEGWVSRLSAAFPDYERVGTGRNFDKSGEASPVFYKKDKYELVDSGTFWLSETPDRPSRGWDAQLNRVCSYAVLRDLKTGFIYAHFNAHLDHMGAVARFKSIDVIADRISRICVDIPAVLTGDFNAREGSRPYKRALETGMRDVKYLAENASSGETYHGYFGGEGGEPIDYIFVNAFASDVESYIIDREKINGVFASDHHPVISEITLFRGKVKDMYRTATFNLLCAGKGKRSWKNRIPLVCEAIRKISPDSFGVQEAHIGWMTALCTSLPEYDYVGVGRDDGKTQGEFAAVFYKKDKFQASDSGNFWISETPDVPSIGWDAACIRIASYVKLTDKANGKAYVHMNVHLDHVGNEARVRGVEMLREKAASFEGIPVICTGDFNVGQGSDCYNAMTDGNMADARVIAEDSDETATYHGFTPKIISEKIDFIFVDKNTVRVSRFRVFDEKINGEFYSDHYAVYADFELV